MTMTLRQLRYFLVLAEELHFTRAAERLNISQPPLSASLRQLEEDLGVRLIERGGRAARLTEAGVVFADRAARVLGQLASARDAVALVAGGAAGSVAIGFVPSMILRELPRLMTGFEESHPGVELRLEERNSADLLERLVAHDIDVGFLHAVPLPEGVAHLELQRERFVCCLSRGHRLATRSRVGLGELAGERVLVFSRDYAAHYHDRIVGLLRAANVEPHLDFRIRSWFTIVALVAQRMGVSLVPQTLARAGAADVAFVEVNEPEAQHAIALVWREGGLSDAARSFVAAAQRFYVGDAGFDLAADRPWA
jgi:DNA-binding transcriptional LysR family regulator